MISLTKNNLWIDISPNWVAFCGPYSFLINLYIFIRIGLYSIPLDFWESGFVEYNHWPARSLWFDRAGYGSVPYLFSTLIAVRVRFSNQPFLCFPFSVLYSVLSGNHHFCRRLSYLWALQAHSFRRLSYLRALQAPFCCGLSWNSQIRFDINWWLSAAPSLHDRCGMIGTGEAWWNVHLTAGQWSLYRSFVR